ncbi:MAG: Redox-sensing transcriptional repressor Rex [Candidatus Aerophobetes bacterium ADurb.Bin490]|nr:MAG: Redox-sensing transcriptional repressor Rex [Candidatus Aerophobetes bacterium ADurb.Bin490]HPI02211.1 redox-sensing transcriptional repressor Rex [Candidatus Goldiibacteriota bacterium]HPN63818.1 redox-sensing transcriptional repressor Rex [Candidatus Goldiibacteriota bacterium]HRQ43767.1 redox-sensing transcriptional repressor Rex [Candidatus Goldiibacteriota bacterium]
MIKKIPLPTVNRLSLYLKCFSELSAGNVEYVSSEQVARQIGLNPAQVRKDLAYFGKFGRRGFGYHVEQLKENISKILGTHKGVRVAVVGTGNLGSALLMYRGFEARGFKVVAGFDVDPDKVGWELDGVKIYDSEDMEKVIKKEKIEILIITTPAAVIPDIFSKLKKTPIKGVLNFAGKHLVSDEDIIIRNVDLALELEQLMFFLTNK